MRTGLCLGISLLLCGAAASAARAGEPERELRLSVTVAPAPRATVDSPVDSFPSGFNRQHTVVVAPSLDYAPDGWWFVGFGPQYALWVRHLSLTAPVAGSEIDLRARVGAQAHLFEQARVYGYLAPGYSLIVPSGDVGRLSNPHGVVVAGALGAALDMRPGVFFSMELGLQEGFQVGESDGSPVDYKTRFFHAALGIGVRLL